MSCIRNVGCLIAGTIRLPGGVQKALQSCIPHTHRAIQTSAFASPRRLHRSRVWQTSGASQASSCGKIRISSPINKSLRVCAWSDSTVCTHACVTMQVNRENLARERPSGFPGGCCVQASRCAHRVHSGKGARSTTIPALVGAQQ